MLAVNHCVDIKNSEKKQEKFSFVDKVRDVSIEKR